ncbi:MAG TPA: redoxin domain-containing protein [Gemmatimonadales bacterium]|jgi:peroxiredoxin Q/BCP
MRSRFLAACAALLLPVAMVAQSTTPKVGDMAPDFTLAAGTRAGISDKPVTLSSLRGQVVVIAFYPRQRSSGCTIQMTHYRDAYQSIFNGGKGVKLLAVSTDSVKDIASWAKDSAFQFTMLSDVNGTAGKEYNTMYPKRNMEQRILFVVAPNGRIAYVMSPFNEIAATSYDELTKAIHDAKGAK